MEEIIIEESIQQETAEIHKRITTPKAPGAMVFGVCAIGSFWMYAIPGIIFGIIALSMAGKANRLYKQNPEMYTPGSKKMISTGRTTGLIGLILSVLMILVVAVLIIANS